MAVNADTSSRAVWELRRERLHVVESIASVRQQRDKLRRGGCSPDHLDFHLRLMAVQLEACEEALLKRLRRHVERSAVYAPTSARDSGAILNDRV